MAGKVIISGGGTGGHVFPALSIGNALKRIDPSIELLFVGALGKMEMEKVPEAGYEIVGLPVRGFRRKISFYNFKVLFDLFRSLVKARKIIKKFDPDVVVGVGGYASGPIGKVAVNRGIPLVLQEQNSYAGVTNRLLAGKASRICVAYDGMERFFDSKKIVKTGNPVRKDLLACSEKKEEGIDFYGLDKNRKTILVTGGSLGAGTVNAAVKNHLNQISDWKDVQILWQCGSRYFDSLEIELSGMLPGNIKLVPFLKRMDLAYAVADIVVARAGASTISELCILGKASILIPSPNVAEDHQTKNARSLSDNGAACMIADKDADAELCGLLYCLVHEEDRLEALRKNIKKYAVADSDEIIAEEVLNFIKD